jgi:hypothetical protein
MVATAFPEVTNGLQKLPELTQHWPGVTRSCCTTAVASLKGAPAPASVRHWTVCASAHCIMLTLITARVIAIAMTILPIFIVIKYLSLLLHPSNNNQLCINLNCPMLK